MEEALNKLSGALEDIDGKGIVAVLTPDNGTLLAITPMTNREFTWLIASTIIEYANHDDDGAHFENFLVELFNVARLMFKHRRKFKTE